MSSPVLEMFSKSSFTVLPGKYIYTKVSKKPSNDNHFMVTQDQDEITVVTLEENLSKLDITEKNQHNWKLISLNLAIPFMSGTLAAINTACAEKELNNLIVSTYSKDYIFVREDQLVAIKNVLSSLGFKDK